MKADYIAPTPAELDEIKHGNIETRKAFFMRNYDFIYQSCKMCILVKYGRSMQLSDIDDLVNECYVNLPEIDLQKQDYFITSIYDELLFMRFGGKKAYYRDRLQDFPISLDKPLSAKKRTGESEETGASLYDLVSVPSAEEIYLNNDESEQVYSLLEVLKDYLTSREFEVMQYRFLTGLSAQEIGAEVGRTKGAILSQIATARKNLVLHYREILSRLADMGFEKSLSYLINDITPPDYNEVQAFYDNRRKKQCERARLQRSTADGRARKNAYQREYWSRRRVCS